MTSTLDQYDDAHSDTAKYLEFVPRLTNFAKAGTLNRRSVERMVRNMVEASELLLNTHVTSYDGFPVTLARARKILEEGVLSFVESNPSVSLPDVSSKDRFLDFQDRIAADISGHSNLALFHLYHAQFAMKFLISEIASLHPPEALFWHHLLDAAFYDAMGDTFRELVNSKSQGMAQFLGKKFRFPPLPFTGGPASSSFEPGISSRNQFFRGQVWSDSDPSGNHEIKPRQSGGGGGGAQPGSRQ